MPRSMHVGIEHARDRLGEIPMRGFARAALAVGLSHASTVRSAAGAEQAAMTGVMMTMVISTLAVAPDHKTLAPSNTRRSPRPAIYILTSPFPLGWFLCVWLPARLPPDRAGSNPHVL